MMKISIVLGLIICSLLFAATVPIGADFNEVTLDDPLDDVIDYFATYSEEEGGGEEVYFDDKPNIDIDEVIYSRSGNEITMEFIINSKGVFENRGDVETDEDIVSYIVYFTTKKLTDGALEEIDYSIVYINQSLLINDEDTDFQINDNILSFSFNLASSEESFFNMGAGTFDIHMDPEETSLAELLNSYWNLDVFPNGEKYDVDVTAVASGSPKAREAVTFQASVKDNDADYMWEWWFGDGETSKSRNPKHTYSEDGKYTVYAFAWQDDFETGGYTIMTITVGEGGSEDEDDEGSGLMVFLALIAVVVIAGVGVLIWFLRR